MEILCVSSTNKRVVSLLNYCSLFSIIYRFVLLFFFFVLGITTATVFSASKRKLNNLGALGDAPH